MRSIIKDDKKDRCFICHRYGKMQVHHMLHGCHRKNADHFGLTVHLCNDCHRALHDKGYYDQYLEGLAQIAFESKYGHDEFMKVFQKSWL